jgi:hypothetical protein
MVTDFHADFTAHPVSTPVSALFSCPLNLVAHALVLVLSTDL